MNTDAPTQATGSHDTEPLGESLRQAAASGEVETMKSLIGAGANIESKCRFGWTPLNGSTPLHRAAAKGDVEAIKFLLESGASIETRTGEVPFAQEGLCRENYHYVGHLNPNGCPDGQGTVEFKGSGRCYSGRWTDCKRTGYGTTITSSCFLIDAGGEVYVGKHTDGEFHGRGKLTTATGSVQEGRWIEGVLKTSHRAENLHRTMMHVSVFVYGLIAVLVWMRKRLWRKILKAGQRIGSSNGNKAISLEVAALEKEDKLAVDTVSDSLANPEPEMESGFLASRAWWSTLRGTFYLPCLSFAVTRILWRTIGAVVYKIFWLFAGENQKPGEEQSEEESDTTRFDITLPLGSGGHADVFRACNNEYVAVNIYCHNVWARKTETTVTTATDRPSSSSWSLVLRKAAILEKDLNESQSSTKFGGGPNSNELSTSRNLSSSHDFVEGQIEADDEKLGLRNEFALQRKPNHKNVVRVLDYQRDTTTNPRQVEHRVFMELMPGGSVSQLLKDSGPIPEQQIKQLFEEILCGLDYLHSENVLHLDMKPGNIPRHILIAGDGTINVPLEQHILKSRTHPKIPDHLTEELKTLLKAMFRIDRKLRPDLRDPYFTGAPDADWTPLHVAAAHGEVETMKSMIRAGANIESKTEVGSTPLHRAAASGKAEAMKFLLEAGANIEARDTFYGTPLHTATERGDLEPVKLLVEAGANIEAETKTTETPYQIAFANCHRDVVTFLKGLGAAEAKFHRNDFEIFWNQILGRGGSANVYKARDTKRHRDVAVKICQATDSARSDLRRESALLQTLKHKSIVQHIFYHFDEELREHQVFMDLQEGSLATKIRQSGPMSEYDMHQATKGMLESLAYLHEQGVIHRDLKPGNVLIAGHDTVKLADFGCSTSLMQQGMTITTQYVEGTAPYRAPEVFRGEYSEGSDLWALACCVVEMATAKRPWAETNKVGAELERHIRASNSHPQITDHLTPELKQILTKMFDQDPMERGNAKELLTDPYFEDKFRWDTLMDSRFLKPDTKESNSVHSDAPVPSSTGEGTTTRSLFLQPLLTSTNRIVMSTQSDSLDHVATTQSGVDDRHADFIRRMAMTSTSTAEISDSQATTASLHSLDKDYSVEVERLRSSHGGFYRNMRDNQESFEQVRALTPRNRCLSVDGSTASEATPAGKVVSGAEPSTRTLTEEQREAAITELVAASGGLDDRVE